MIIFAAQLRVGRLRPGHGGAMDFRTLVRLVAVERAFG